jgi:hypothetical protein
MKTDRRKSDVIFLLGAGASVEAGVHTSNEITDILVNYGSYCPSENSSAIENLLRYIQVKIADYLQVKASDVNFEYILGTLMELSKKEEYSIVPFLGEGDSLVKKLEKVISVQEVIDKLYALLREMLFVRNSVDYLNPLKTFFGVAKPIDVFTLNYDISVETAFDNNKISYTTGFKRRKNGKPIWNPSQFGKKSFDARIYKLHGSVNWGQYFHYPPPPMKSEPTASASTATDYYLSYYPERIEFNPFPIGQVEPPERKKGMVSIMNFGTRKELLYAESIFTILFNQFLTSLNRAKICIVCGYSFRDERINKILEEAVVSRKGNLHLIIVDPAAFSIGSDNSILRKFMAWQWYTPLQMTLGSALKDGFLSETVKKLLKEKNPPQRIYPTVPINESEKKQKPDIKKILLEWRNLGISFDLTFFWMYRLWPQLKKLAHCSNESDAVKVGHLLMPLNRKIRDLCYQIRCVYEAMHLNSGFDGEYLNTIKVKPQLVNDFSQMDLVRKWLPELGKAVSMAFNAYDGITPEFRRAVTDPNYGKVSNAPNNIGMAGFIIRHDIYRTYELACILNDIYKGAGYEEPFKMIKEVYCENVGENGINNRGEGSI